MLCRRYHSPARRCHRIGCLTNRHAVGQFPVSALRPAHSLRDLCIVVAYLFEYCATRNFGKGDRVRHFSRYCSVLLFVATVFLVQTDSSLWAQESSVERIFFHAKVFTGNPQEPYAEAVAIRGEKIIAVGS